MTITPRAVALAALLCFCGPLQSAEAFLVKSADNGKSWVDIDPGAPYENLYNVLVNPITSKVYAIAATGNENYTKCGRASLLVSADAGQTWETLHDFGEGCNYPIFSKWLDSNTLIVALQVHEGPRTPITSMAIAKIAVDGGSLEKYSAEGLQFRRGRYGYHGYPMDFAVDFASPSNFYVAVADERADHQAHIQSLWASSDEGRNWRRLDPPLDFDCAFPTVHVDPLDSTLYLGCVDGILRSTDRGETWSRRLGPEGIPAGILVMGPGAPVILYLVNQGADADAGATRLWRSTDSAETWTETGAFVAEGYLSISVHPNDPAMVFGTAFNETFESSDAGATWTRLADKRLYVRPDPNQPGLIYGYSWRRQLLPSSEN